MTYERGPFLLSRGLLSRAAKHQRLGPRHRGTLPGASLRAVLLGVALAACGGETVATTKTRLSFLRVSAGGLHTCGVTPADSAYCWGYDGDGELGNGATTKSTTPVPVSGGLPFASVSAGGGHTCGVTPAGGAYCWGWNVYGQLGDGTTTDRPTPVAVSGGLTFASLSAGNVYNCGVTPAGAGYCWGWNKDGELGIGTTTGPQTCWTVVCSMTPVAVSGGLPFASVSAGGGHTCGVTPAGGGYCWGANGIGELGNGTTTTSPTPVAVSGGLIFAGVLATPSGRTCGVTPAGAAYCWGWNKDGELGIGTTTGPQTCGPVDPEVFVACSLTPAAVSGGLSFASVSARGDHTCGVTPAGAAYCWGLNLYGELGNGTAANSSVPVPVSQ